MRKPPVCLIEGITKRFGPVLALDNVSLHVNEGEILGIVGENGAGKSTLLKVLSGLCPQDSGQIEFKGKPVRFRSYHEAALAGMSMVFQEQALVPNLHVYENLFLSFENRFERLGILSVGRMIDAAREELAELGLEDAVDPTRITSSYDYSTRQMIEITKAFTLSRLLGVERPLLLLDEPTEGLADHEVGSLFAQMKQSRQKASMIFVSHRLSEVLRICDRIYVFKDGSVVTDVATEGVTEAELHELMVGRQRDVFFYREAEQLTPSSEVVLEARNLTKKGCFEDVSFQLHKNEILGIAGVLGSGKEELGRALVGATKFDQGAVLVEGRAPRPGSTVQSVRHGIGHVPKERGLEGAIDGLSVCWNIGLPSLRGRLATRAGILRVKREKKMAQEYCAQLRVATPSIGQLMRNLSGGNQQKVVVAKWLAADLKVLVLDNPTRGVDVGAKHELYGVFRDIVRHGIPILLVSDELLELIGLSNRIIVMKDKKVIDEVPAAPDGKPSERELVQHMV